MTDTPRRRTLVPRSALAAVIIIVLLIGAAVAAGVTIARSRRVLAPNVVDIPVEIAEERIVATGLVSVVDGTRVSTEIAAGRVITQEPAAGTRLQPGSTVRIVVSAGPQTFAVPDLIGSTIDDATKALTALGFLVTSTPVSSETTEGIVVTIYPAPGTSASAGDEVRLGVASPSSEQEMLLPYDLAGVSVLIDPLPSPSTATGDVPMEIARRLQSLFEAAGATVSVTRTGNDLGAAPDARRAQAESSGATLFVGIDLGATGTPGIRALHLAQKTGSQREADSVEYARSITRAANLPGLIVNEPLPSGDPVLVAFAGAGVRVVVGDSTDAADRARFSDPGWADQVARAIYRGVGTVTTKQ